MSDEEKWKRRIDRERAARAQAEALLEKKSLELYEANVLLEATNASLEEQVEAEINKFHREEKKFKALFDSATDGIILYNSEGNVILANQALCNLMKIQVHEALGQSFWDFLKSKRASRSVAFSAYRELLQNGATRFDFELLSYEDEIIPCEISAVSFQVEDEVLIQVIIRDITERKKAAKALKEARNTAIQANEAKSLFLATMSHEIRTPLNGIIGFTDLMIQETVSEQHSEYLSLIKKSGGMLLNIINDILDFSKIESRQIELEEIDFNLQECIEGTLDIHSQTAASKSIELLCQIDDNVEIGLRGDMGRLQQVLLNLVSNALKFTEEGFVSLNVHKASEKFIEISVKDTGIGFSKDVAEKLFSPFQQADASTTRKYGGTGLGLAICRELIETMGGAISSKSELGKGSEFTILLPFLPSRKPVKKVAQQFDLSWMRGLRALVVDDVDINLVFMKARLLSWGMKPTLAHSAKEALKILETEEHPFNLILLDMLMPEMDGMELASILTKQYGEELPPLMLVTSARLAGDRSKAKDLGFSSVVYKPVHERELAREMSRILHDDKSHKTPTSVKLSTNHKVKSKATYALLVEDNPINAKLAKIMVERMGVSVHIAHNGAEALEALKLKPIYDVILMDMQMPVMDGLESTRRIRNSEATEHYANVPIIAMTANAMKEDEMKCIEAGMNRFISKPIDSALLKEFLEEFVSLS